MHPKRILEALLFAASEPISRDQLAQVIEVTPYEVTQYLDELSADYQEHSFQLVEIAHGYQLVSRPEYHSWLKRLYTRQVAARLSSAALETLAIVAYKQPITRAEVEEVRGVNSDSTINSLLEKGLVRIAGRKPGAGRPLLFATTDEFLKHFGIKSLAELPSEEEIDQILHPELDGLDGEINN